MEGISFGDFKVIKKIAEGGMGQVYLARQISLDRDVALKILPERLAKDESFKARFEREAREAARLNHPSIISVYAYGIKDGIPYFAMEFIEGEDLAGLLKKRGKFPVREALRITKEVAKALEAAHKKGVVHRDIKPSNIMLKEDGSVKVTDFGLAKAVGGGSVMVTQANVVLGTPHYMSPEQGKGEKVDTRSDIYSLGVVLYELLSGTVPFKADTPTTLIYMHVYEKPPSIREKNPEVPPAVEALVMKMLMKEPAERFQTPTELVNAIEALESGTYDASAGPMTLEIGAAEGSTISASVASAAEKVSKPSTSLIPLIAVMLILLAGVGVAIFLLSQKQKPKEEESPVVTVPPMQVPERLPTQQPPPQLPVVQPPTVQPPVVQPPIQPEKKEMVKFPAAQILAKLPVGSSLFIRKAQEPETLKQPLLADKEFEAGLYVVSAEKKGYQPISVNFKLEKSGVEPPVDSVKWEFELSEKVKDALRLIKVHIEEQKYRLAMDELENLLKEVSDLEEAQTLLARCKKEYEDFQKIEEDFNEAKRLLKDEEWEKALVVLKRIPTSYKGYEQKVLPLIKQANDELKKSAQFKNLVETARNELKKGEIESTQTYLQMAQNLIPNAKEVTDLLDSVKKLRQIKEDVKIEVDRKNYRVAFKLSEDYLKSAPLCERMRKQQEFIRGEIEKIEASMKRLEAECQTYNATIESSPKDALTAAIKAQEEVKLLRDIFGQDVKESEEKVRTMLERAEVAVAKKGVCDTIKSLDSLFLSGKMNEIVAVVDDQNSALQKRLSKQLSDFFLSGIRVVLSEHKVEQITLSSDKDSAVATCTYSYYFIHSESNVELKGEKKRRISLTRKGGRWFVSEIE